MVQKGVASVKLAMEKLEHFLELGGTKKDITLLVISGIALIVSIFDLVPLPFDASWAAIILCGIPIILEAVIGLVTAFDIKADVLVSLALIASVCIGEDFAAGEVAFIMQLGGLLEELTVARARAGIEKLVHIRAYQAAGDKVCMIGDGVNDVPALKAADVGIAMGGVGSDIAVDAADIALVDDEVTELPHLIALSKRMMRTIKLNITFSLTLNFIAIVLAITGTLNPVVGALVHNAGSVLVITNSALLLKWRQTASQSFASADAKSV
jgi:HAD ATPase, P-type, family IC